MRAEDAAWSVFREEEEVTGSLCTESDQLPHTE